MIDADCLGIACCSTNAIKRRDHIFAAVTVADVQHRDVSREKVSTTVNTRSFFPVAN